MKNKTVYVCKVCGYKNARWSGQCPQCDEWNTLEESIDIPQSNKTAISDNVFVSGRKLKDIVVDKENRIISGIQEFDRVMGGGIVRDSFNLLMAPPGTGKSTLAIMVADKLAENGYRVLYASGEESASQIKNRATRLQLKNSDDIYISDTSNLDFVIDEIKKYDIDFIVLDSIQTFYLNEFLPSKQGNPTQTNGVVSALKDICKQSDRPRSVLAISQMNKKEEVAGFNSIVHIVDSSLLLEGDSTDPLRILYATKNRFGDTEEAGFFYMRENGLQEVGDISNFFISKRDTDVVGVAVTGIREANRYAMCEVESLTPKSFTSFPARISTSVKKDDLNILASILEQRANMVMVDKNIIVKTSGNIKIKDSSSNLAVLVSIMSSYFNKPVSSNSTFYGDVSLTGEIKKCPNLEMFANEADRLGYKKIYVAKNSGLVKKFKNLQVIECNTVVNLIKILFK